MNFSIHHSCVGSTLYLQEGDLSRIPAMSKIGSVLKHFQSPLILYDEK